MVYINSGVHAYEVNLAKRESRAVLADLPHPVLNMDSGGPVAHQHPIVDCLAHRGRYPFLLSRW